MSGSDLEAAFCFYLRTIGKDLPAPIKDYVFHQTRGWQIDFAWPEVKVAVECEGIDHRKSDRYHRDIEKYNALALDGWVLIRITTRLLNSDPDKVFALLRRTIERGDEMKLHKGDIERLRRKIELPIYAESSLLEEARLMLEGLEENEAENSRLRPVVEAAMRWRRVNTSGAPYDETTDALIDLASAVDAYLAASQQDSPQRP